MGLTLYGNEFNQDTTPLDGGMERFLDMDKEFTGKKALLEQQKRGVPRRLIGFAADGRRTPRHENRIIAGNRPISPRFTPIRTLESRCMVSSELIVCAVRRMP